MTFSITLSQMGKSKTGKTLQMIRKKDGFNFVGSTICYAYMQSMGMVNDHLIECFRHEECAVASRT